MNYKDLKMCILGCGNVGGSIAEGIYSTGEFESSNITITRRSEEGLKKFEHLGFNSTLDNHQAVKNSEVIIITVTPQRLNNLLDEIKDEIDADRHIILSGVSGASVDQIKNHLGKDVPVIRVMPNIAVAIRQSMTCIAGKDEDKEALDKAMEIFNLMGETVRIHEELMVPATALCACGIAFFMRAIRAASQGGIEIGFHSEDALFMATQTAKGAASMLTKAGSHPENEVDKVTTPMGCTIFGLNQMEHSGFSSSMIKGILASAEKAATLYSNDKK